MKIRKNIYIIFSLLIFLNSIIIAKAAPQLSARTLQARSANTLYCNGAYIQGTNPGVAYDNFSYDSNSHYIYDTWIHCKNASYTGIGWWGHNSAGWWFSYKSGDNWYYLKDQWLMLQKDGVIKWYFLIKMAIC